MPTPHEYVAKDDQRTWRVRFRYNKKSCSETFSTRREADVFCTDIENRGVHTALKLLYVEGGSTPTLDEVAERFFTWKANHVRSDRTIADYRRDYRNWIAPRFGGREVGTIDERDVQAWVDDMGSGVMGRKLSPKSSTDRHAILYGILAWASAASREIVDHNAAEGTELPKRQKTQPKGLRPGEWQALHAALKQIDPDAADLAEFLLATGWRFSEAIALSVFDVEDDGVDVHVTMTQVVRRNAENRHAIVRGGKSDAAMRRIKLDAAVAQMVRARADHKAGDELVFMNHRGNQWHHANFRDRAWNPAVEAANLTRRPTPHWLRHTSVAWLVMTGKVSLPEIQRRIGHESIQTTINVYGRMIDDVSADALDAFAALRGDGQRQIEG